MMESKNIQNQNISIKNIRKIISLLRKKYPDDFHGSNLSKEPFQVLIGTVLSHQTRDEFTIKASKNLFSKFPTAYSLANAKLNLIKKLIRPVGMYNMKAIRIKKISKILVEKYKGKVPKEYSQVVALPGVGRKTANILFSYSYNNPNYIAVDTHVHRISNRLGLVKTKRAEETETELYNIIPKSQRKYINSLFVQHGQKICKAKPKCSQCIISIYCDYYSILKKSW